MKLLETAQGLQYLHDLGVVHGDVRAVGGPDGLVSPDSHYVKQNILIGAEGAAELCDFGYSRIASQSQGDLSTSCGEAISLIVGFTAPEFFYDQDVWPDFIQDIYAFGGVILEV